MSKFNRKEYRQRLKTVKADLLPDYKEKIDYIVENQGISIAEWMRQKIEEDYKRIKKWK